MTKSPALLVTAVAAFLTLAFHLFPADRPFGIPLALFNVLLVAGIVMIAKAARTGLNGWAAVFLLPAGIATAAQILYASPTVQILGPFITLISLVFFAFWLTVPRIAFWSVATLWPGMLFLHTLYPFQQLDTYVTNLSSGKRGVKVLLGAVIALPFLLVIGSLFASADPLFRKTIGDLFEGVNAAELVWKLFRDGIIAFLLVSLGWTMLNRLSKERAPDAPFTPAHPNPTVLTTFLGLLNALFLLFIGFQVPYFFGGETFLRDQGLVYAEYARNGFFQLITVAGIVFCISWAVYAFTHMRERWSRVLTVGLIAETAVILISAVKRLLLYIDAYGLSVSRWWAMLVIFIIALTLGTILISALLKTPYHQLAKTTFLMLLVITSLPLLWNVEASVVRYNAERYASGKTDIFDHAYIWSLSSDAVPEMVDIVAAPISTRMAEIQTSLRERLTLKSSELNMNSSDWRNLVISDYRAIAALEKLK